MEQIIQLKSMRDAALERLQLNPDFKLVNSLDALIIDLEAVMAPPAEIVAETIVSEEPVEMADAPIAAADIPGEEEPIEVKTAPEDAEELPANSELAAQETAPDAEADDAVEALADPATSEPEDVSSAIEALEAELAQSDVGVEKPSGSMIN